MAETFDVVVVGCGMAGVSIGYELAATRRVAVVEAAPMPATQATGRSAATYLPSYGGPEVRALTAASRARFDELRDRFELPDPLRPRPLLWVAGDDEGERAARGLLADRPETLVELGAREALARCPALDPARLRMAALDAAAEDIDVLAVHQGYLRGLRARGGVVHVSSPVTAVRPTAGAGWRVTAGGLMLDCAVVVNAAGAWADRIAELAGLPAAGLVPRRRTLFTSPVRADAPWGPDSPLIGDTAERWYAKPEGRGVLASPADAEPGEPGEARPDELGIARALEEINEHTRLGLRSVSRSWAGQRTFSPDGAPVVGAWPGRPGFVMFAGQGGYGIQMAPALAAFGAAVCRGEPVPADIAVAAEALAPARLSPRR